MNIINLLPKHYIEHEYFNKMCKVFDQTLMKDFKIYISDNYKELPSYGENVIAILTAGDEKGNPPLYSDKVKFVFKHHLDSDNIKNVYHIPLTYKQGFIGDSSIPINKRKYDLFFVGRSSKREDMIDALNELQTKRPELKYRVFITGYKFMGGWDVEKYSKEMMNSKIVLSPRGAVRAECLRFTEAVKCGSAIISCKHPNVTCFNQCPAKYLDSWKDLEKTVLSILQDPNTLDKISEQTKCSWENHFSPEAVGKYINKTVRGV